MEDNISTEESPGFVITFLFWYDNESSVNCINLHITRQKDQRWIHLEHEMLSTQFIWPIKFKANALTMLRLTEDNNFGFNFWKSLTAEWQTICSFWSCGHHHSWFGRPFVLHHTSVCLGSVKAQLCWPYQWTGRVSWTHLWYRNWQHK